MILTIIIFLALLSVLVVVHEAGHFFLARRAGMTVHEFGLGFPPRLFAWKDKKGTEWTINLIPLGGFVRIKGENGEEMKATDSFTAKSKSWRAAVLLGGVTMNFILAAVIYSGVNMVGTDITGPVPSEAKVLSSHVDIYEVLKGTDAKAQNLPLFGTISKVDGVEMNTEESIKSALMADAAANKSVTLTIKSGSDFQDFTLKPQYLDELKTNGYGIGMGQVSTIRYNVLMAIPAGFRDAFLLLIAIVAGLYKVLHDLIIGAGVSDALSGPVGIATLTGQVARLGIIPLLNFAAILSLNLAVLNILPFPALDGGRLLFLAIEAIRRKPMNEQLEGRLNQIGFACLLILVILVTYRDIAHLIH